MKYAALGLGCLCGLWMCHAEELVQFERMQFNNPGLEVELSLGIWPQANVSDFDGDGKLDLMLKACGAPMKGSKRTSFCRLYPDFLGSVPNSLGSVPSFLGSVPTGKDIPITAWKSPLLSWPGHSPAALPDWKDVPYPRKGNGRAMYHADFDGDGVEDALAVISDWTNYGKVGSGCTQTAYNDKNCWTNSIIETYAFFFKGSVPTKMGSVPKKMPEKMGSVPKWERPRQVVCEGSDKPFLEGPFGGHKLFIHDFDGDGDLDFIAAEFVDSFWYFENISKNGEFKVAKGRRVVQPNGKPIRVDLCMYEPTWVDVTGDRLLDIVAAEEGGNVCWFENTGKLDKNRTPIFKPHPYLRQQAQELKFGCLATPYAVDFDGDGDVDFVSGNSAGYLAFIENLSGPGVERPKWAAPRLLTVNEKPIRTMAGWSGSPQGPAERKWGYSSVTVGDWDGDGILDVISNDINGDVLFYRGKKSGSVDFHPAEFVEVDWKKGHQTLPEWDWRKPVGKRLKAPWRTTVEMTDWNQDGLQDLISIDFEGYLCFYERVRRPNKTLVLKEPQRIFVTAKGDPIRLQSGICGGSGRARFALGDWDQDGKTDILVAQWNAVLWRQVGERDGQFVFEYKRKVGEDQLQGHGGCPTLPDFNGDGIPDLVFAAEDGYFYYLRNPLGKLNTEAQRHKGAEE